MGKKDAQKYKTNYLKYLKNKVGLKIVGAYGNTNTDIMAYRAANIPVYKTFIIGKNAGKNGTRSIHHNYKSHYEWLKKTLLCVKPLNRDLKK